jgi:hypothetical protein
MAYKRKTVDVWHLYINYGFGHGWEDETAEATFREIRERAREYRENCPEYPVRIRVKRERIAEVGNNG